MIQKGQEVKNLPAGTAILLQRGEDGTWSGSISSPGRSAITGEASGATGLLAKLARRWLNDHGIPTRGKA